MMASLNHREIEEHKGYYGVSPKKFMLWMSMASITMLFAALSSALVVKKADYQSWVAYGLPNIFIISTVVIVVNSIIVHFAMRAYKKIQFAQARLLLFITMLCSSVFLFTQWLGWERMNELGIYFNGNPSGSFLYVMSGLHAVHLIFGMFFMLITFVNAIRARKKDTLELNGEVNPRRKLSFEMLATYWHFVDGIWIYLFIFLSINYS